MCDGAGCYQVIKGFSGNWAVREYLSNGGFRRRGGNHVMSPFSGFDILLDQHFQASCRDFICKHRVSPACRHSFAAAYFDW